jgi:type I restriction enzyme S subunit
MNVVELAKYVVIKTGKLDANASVENGVYPFFTCSVEPKSINEFAFEGEYVIVAGNGDLNVKYYNGKFNAYQRTYAIKPKELLNGKYLYYFLEKYLDKLRELSIGGVIKYIKIGNLTEAKIPLPPLEHQKKIAAILDAADAYRQKTKAIIAKYDELTQSLFLDMFGDPVRNEKGWKETELIEIAKTKNDVKCGPFGTQLSKSEYLESGIPIWGIPQINSNFKKKPTEYISQSKALELNQYSVRFEDIVMSRKGNVGSCALFPSELIEGILHSDAIRIRVNKDLILPIVLLIQFRKSKVLQTQISNVSSGAIMAGINVTKLKNVIVQVPKMNVQNQFAERVQAIEEQKSQAQTSLEKAEELFNSLLQRAFNGELV